MEESDTTLDVGEFYGPSPNGVFVSQARRARRIWFAAVFTTLGLVVLSGGVYLSVVYVRGSAQLAAGDMVGIVGIVLSGVALLGVGLTSAQTSRFERIEIDFAARELRLENLLFPIGLVPIRPVRHAVLSFDAVDRAFRAPNPRGFDQIRVQTDEGVVILQSYMSDFDQLSYVFDRIARRSGSAPLYARPLLMLALFPIAAVILLGIMHLIFVTTTSPPQQAQRDFESGFWMAASPIARQRMVRDLLEQGVLMGESRESVLALLGLADDDRRAAADANWHWESWYFLDRSFDDEEREAWLRITFDDAGTATSAEVITR